MNRIDEGDRPVLGLVGLPDRGALLAALTEACAPQSAPSVLALFGFQGLKDHLETISRSRGDAVIEDLAANLRPVLRPGTGIFRGRRGELIALGHGDLDGWSSIVAALAARETVSGMGSTPSLVALPIEGGTPIAVLRLANERLVRRNASFRSLTPQ